MLVCFLFVFFICIGNFVCLIFVEVLLCDFGGDCFIVYFVGIWFYFELNFFVLQVLVDKGYDVSVLCVKNVLEFQGEDVLVFDFVFIVCDQVVNEDCLAWEGQLVSVYWGMFDLVKVIGIDVEQSFVFQQVYGVFWNCIFVFVVLFFDSFDWLLL